MNCSIRSFALAAGPLLVLACSGEDDAAGPDVAPADASVGCAGDLPICTAFRNSGRYGGFVEVAIEPGASEAVVRSNSLPDYETSTFGDNPNDALPQDLELHLPVAIVAGPSDAGVGHVGIAWNGVSLFNPSDARDIGGCTGNAAYLESDGVDALGGHPTRTGEYHYHTGDFLRYAGELGLVNQPGAHSSLVGYAFDGIPIYGSYGFADPLDRDSEIAELRSCYRLKEERSCCTAAPLCAPSSSFGDKLLVMGAFIEDFEFDAAAHAAGACDLDEFNSRLAVTPEHTSPARVYVMTFDAGGAAAFPFIFGTRYWGQPLDQP